MTNLFGRAANKFKRELLRFGPVRVVAESAYLRALERHVPSLPPLDARDLPIVEALRSVGTKIVPVESLALPTTSGMLAALHTLVDELKNKPRNGSNAPRLPIDRLMDFPEIYLWGLDERLLALVENHIGLPVRYHGPDVRREIADGVTNDVRQWHIDAEDRRMFKVIVYLNDVEHGGGAFEYIDRVRSAEVARALHYSSGFVKDAVMDGATRPEDRVECTAPAHTAIFVDTCKVFHRARPPQARDRFSVTFSYTSTSQVKLYETIHLSHAARDRILQKVSARQRAVLPAFGNGA